MAIEIRELVIRTDVRTREDKANTLPVLDERLSSMKRQIIQECMDRMAKKMRGLRRRR